MNGKILEYKEKQRKGRLKFWSRLYEEYPILHGDESKSKECKKLKLAKYGKKSGKKYKSVWESTIKLMYLQYEREDINLKMISGKEANQRDRNHYQR
jgi:hypothetical protein